MNRRKFIKVVGLGTAAIYLSGCGLSAVENKNKKESEVSAQGNVSEGHSMKIVVINSSPHSEEKSTSRYLAAKFVQGARDIGHEVFVFDAANEKTHPCKGCDQCGMDGACIFDDAIEIKLMPKMLKADLIVLVTPLYYFGMSAQLKTVVDRFYSRTSRLNHKNSMIIATAWNSADWTMEALKNHYETLVRYMNWQDVGQIWATGCGTRAAVENSEFGDMAYRIGAGL